MKKRIVHLTTVHRWDDTRIFVKMCRSLAAAGHEVHLIAPANPPGDCVVDQVIVHRMPRPRNRLERVTRTMTSVLQLASQLRADLYHFHDPELIPAGIALKLFGYRVIYDVHEDVPSQILQKRWLPGWARPLLSRATGALEDLGARCFDGVVAATTPIARKFPATRRVVVNNYSLLEEFSSITSDSYDQRPYDVAYVGGLSPDRGLRQLVEAIGHSNHSRARLLLGGRFEQPSFERELMKRPEWRRVGYRGWCSRQEVAGMLSQCRAGLVTLLPLERYVVSQPVKLFEYLAAGLPVVASDFPLWREIVAESKCGLLVDPEDPQAIADATDWLFRHPQEASDMGRNGRRAVLEKYNWSHEFDVLSNFYRRFLSGGKAFFLERGTVKHAA